MLDDYFDDADYFKLTGDGMMVIYAFEDEQTLVAKLRKAVESSRRLVATFGNITENDPMINFPVPPDIGIGLARGSATVIFSDDTILDFTGRPLNLAARLMDLARPSGIVFDVSLGIDLLDPDTQKDFSHDEVYIKGIAEEEPIKVHYLANRTKIPEYSKLPIRAPIRVTEPSETAVAREIGERGSEFEFELAREPAKTDDAEIHFTYPRARKDGRKDPNVVETDRAKVKVERKLNRWYAVVNFKTITRRLEKSRCKPEWKVTLTLEYSVRDTGKPSSKT